MLHSAHNTYFLEDTTRASDVEDGDILDEVFELKIEFNLTTYTRRVKQNMVNYYISYLLLVTLYMIKTIKN